LLFETMKERNAMAAADTERGAGESIDRLEELTAALAPLGKGFSRPNEPVPGTPPMHKVSRATAQQLGRQSLTDHPPRKRKASFSVRVLLARQSRRTQL